MIQLFNKTYNNDVYIIKMLQNIFGIGYNTAKYLCFKSGLNLKSRVGDVDESIFRIILNEIKKEIVIEEDLKKRIQRNIIKKKKMNCYQGFRHIRGLPVRGQRTHTNGRTKKRLSIYY